MQFYVVHSLQVEGQDSCTDRSQRLLAEVLRYSSNLGIKQCCRLRCLDVVLALGLDQQYVSFSIQPPGLRRIKNLRVSSQMKITALKGIGISHHIHLNKIVYYIFIYRGGARYLHLGGYKVEGHRNKCGPGTSRFWLWGSVDEVPRS